MSQHSVVEAKNQLSQLIERALKGEDVVITRHGTPVVELKAVKRGGRRMTEADFEWLDAHTRAAGVTILGRTKGS